MTAKSDILLVMKARDRATKSLTGLQRSLVSVGKKGRAAFAGINKVALSTRGALLAVVGAASAFETLVRQPAQFSEELAKVGTLGREARDSLGEFKKEVIRIGTETGTSFRELNQGLFNTISAGVEAGKSIEFLEQANKLAIAGSADLGVSVSGLTSLMESYGLSSEMAEEASKELFATQVIGKTTLQDVAGSIGNVAAQAAEANIPIDQLSTGIAQLTLTNGSAEKSSTALRAAITAILKPTDKLKSVMRLAGVEQGKAAFEGREVGEVFGSISSTANKLGKSLEELGVPQEALIAFYRLGAENGERFRELLARQRQAIDEFEPSLDLMGKTLNRNARRLTNFGKGLAIAFSGPALRTVKQSLGGLNKDTSELTGKAVTLGLKFTNALLGVAKVAGIIGIGFTNILLNLRSWINVVRKVRNSMLSFFEDVIVFGVEKFKQLFDFLNARVRDFESSLNKALQLLGKGPIDLPRAPEISDDFVKEFSKELGKEASKRRQDANDIQAQILQDRADLAELKEFVTSGIDEARAQIRKEIKAQEDLNEKNAEQNAIIRKKNEQLKKSSEAVKQIKDELVASNQGLVSLFDFARGGVDSVLGFLSRSTGRRLEEERERRERLERGAAFAREQDPGFNGGNFNFEGFAAFRDELRELNQEFQTSRDIGRIAAFSLEDAFVTAFDSIGKKTEDVKEAFKSLVASILSDLTRLFARRAATGLLSFLFGGRAGGGAGGGVALAGAGNPFAGFTGAFGALFGDRGTTLVEARAQGGLLSGPFQAFQAGGIVSRPTVGIVGEGGDEEAVVPLPGGNRKIPVELRRGRDTGSMTVQIHNSYSIQAVDRAGVNSLLSSPEFQRAHAAATEANLMRIPRLRRLMGGRR